jgi:hypothetical protein
VKGSVVKCSEGKGGSGGVMRKEKWVVKWCEAKDWGKKSECAIW